MNPSEVQGTFSSPEHGASNTEAKDAFFAYHQNLIAAQAMVAMEHLLLDMALGKQVDAKEMEKISATIPERMIGAFQEGFYAYETLWHDAQACREEMDRVLRDFHQILGTSATEAKRLLNWRIFTEITNEPPVGRLICNIVEPYLFIMFEDPRDYATFYASVSSGADPDSKGTQSSGCYAFKRTLPVLGGRPIGVVGCNGGVSDMAEFKAIVIHERQHFINWEILARFQTMGDTDPPEMRAVKDEFVATVRDATYPERLTHMHMSESYKQLFDRLNFKQRIEAMGAAKALADFMSEWGYYAAEGSNPPPPSRAELVYRLGSINLARWPKWLEGMHKFDERRADRAEIKEEKRSGQSWTGMSAG